MVQQPSAPAQKSVINMIYCISDWLVIMIGPGGLLLVVPHLFAVPISVWMWKILFQGHTSWAPWRCSNHHNLHFLLTWSTAPMAHSIWAISVISTCNFRPTLHGHLWSKFLGANLDSFEANWSLELDPALDP
jgi:hypothetical protein